MNLIKQKYLMVYKRSFNEKSPFVSSFNFFWFDEAFWGIFFIYRYNISNQ